MISLLDEDLINRENFNFLYNKKEVENGLGVFKAFSLISSDNSKKEGFLCYNYKIFNSR